MENFCAISNCLSSSREYMTSRLTSGYLRNTFETNACPKDPVPPVTRIDFPENISHPLFSYFPVADSSRRLRKYLPRRSDLQTGGRQDRNSQSSTICGRS